MRPLGGWRLIRGVEAGEAGSELSFDRAAYEQSGAGPPCANCNGPLGDEYWEFSSRPICGSCKGRISEALAASQSKAAFLRAVLLGGGTALGCGIAYAVFVALTDYQLALITIGIAFVIAKVLRHCSGGAGGRKYQILAVALTYLASTMGYAPAMFAGLKATAMEEPAASSTPAPAGAPDEAPSATAGGLVLAAGIFLALTLAAPFLAAAEAPIGLLIVAFGLWEAWRLTGGVPATIGGPYRKTATATGPPV